MHNKNPSWSKSKENGCVYLVKDFNNVIFTFRRNGKLFQNSRLGITSTPLAPLTTNM